MHRLHFPPYVKGKTQVHAHKIKFGVIIWFVRPSIHVFEITEQMLSSCIKSKFIIDGNDLYLNTSVNAIKKIILKVFHYWRHHILISVQNSK